MTLNHGTSSKLPIESFYKVLPNGCWEWLGGKDAGGYGLYKSSRYSKTTRAHRYVYEWYKYKIPPNMQLDHLCKNRGCVNPEHLEIVSKKENILRGTSFAAINKKKTHCKRGHEFNEENTYKKSNGGRQCKICNNRY